MSTNPQAVGAQAEQALAANSYHQPRPPVLVSPTSYASRMGYPVLAPPAVTQMATTGFDLAPQSNSGSPIGHQTQHKLANSQQLTSRQQPTATNKPHLIDNPLLAMDQARACSQSEINLFNALGLSNMTNNQLVLSLQQQQSILQASAAAAAAAAAAASALPQTLSLGPQEVAFCQPNSTQHSSTLWPGSNLTGADTRTRISTDETFKNLSRQQLQHHQSNADNLADGKEMLKFSISTILGNATIKPLDTDHSHSQPLRGGETSRKLLDQHQDPANPLPFMMSINENTSTKSKEMRHQDAEMRSVNCDHTQSDTDECSSLNQSPTPEAGSSILFNNDQPDHPSANTQHLNGFMVDHHQQPRLHNQNPLQHPFLNGANVFPWAVASRGKPRRGMMRRAVFSDGQRVGLEKRFQLQKYISKPDRKKLAEKLGLRDSQVKIWFQNRRMKWRNSKERELLSAGGSREQTLPTRSNPNPDLSDVGETIKRLTSGSGTEC